MGSEATDSNIWCMTGKIEFVVLFSNCNLVRKRTVVIHSFGVIELLIFFGIFHCLTKRRNVPY